MPYSVFHPFRQAKFAYGGLIEPIFATASAASKIDTCYKSGQNLLKNNNNNIWYTWFKSVKQTVANLLPQKNCPHNVDEIDPKWLLFVFKLYPVPLTFQQRNLLLNTI